MSNSKQVAAASFSMVGIGIVSRILGLIRDQLVAATYGATTLSDAFFLGNVVPTILAGGLGHALSTGLMPPLVSHLSAGKRREAGRLLSAVLGFTLMISTLLAVFGIFGSEWLIEMLAPDYASQEKAVAVMVSRVLFPTMVALTAFSILSTALNVERNFWVPASGAILLNLFSIASLTLHGRFGVVGLAVGLLAGCAAQAVFAWWGLARYGLADVPTLEMPNGQLKRVLALSFPVLATHIIGNLYQLIERGLAARLHSGAISALTFANRVVNIPAGLLGLAIATAAYPLMTQKAATRDQNGFQEAAGFSVRLTLFLTMPVSVGLIVLRHPVVEVLFRHGAFDRTAAAHTATALLYYSIGLVPMSLGTVLAKACYAVEDMKSTVLIGAATAVLNIILDLALAPVMGHNGLAFANTLSYVFYSAMIYWAIHRRFPFGGERTFAKKSLTSLWQSALASAIMGAVTYLLLQWGLDSTQETSLLKRVWYLGWIVVASAGLYGILLWVMGVQEARWLVQWTRRRFGWSGSDIVGR